MKKPVALIIMDGFAFNDAEKGNAIKAAKTPNLDKLFAENPLTTIGASGMDVGLPDGQMGNSEVGHTNIGAGRVIYQELTRITKAIEEKTFFANKALVGAMQNCKDNNKTLHLFGLLSDGGVHSHNTHLYGLLAMAKEYGVSNVVVHGLMDGRDVSPTSGVEFVRELEAMMKELGVGVIGSLIGRFYAMDRDNRWDRVERAYAAMVYGEGAHNDSAVSCMEESYAAGITDEFIEPTVIGGNRISAGDSVICFNFRPDRAREITRAFVDPDFDGFNRTGGLLGLTYVCMTQYDKTMPNVDVAFTPTSLEDTFGEYISKLGKTQLRIAETEKYAHVTFFFNGGVEKEYPGEDRVLVASPKVATYDQKPEMSAYEVTEKVLERIASDKYDAIILNYANCDMVGHTGVFEAAVSAVEAVDECVGKVVDAIVQKGGAALITADHGNADQLIDPETDGVFTAHTTNPVPLCVIGAKNAPLKDGGKLCDLAPTMLEIMGLEKPEAMTGKSLL